MTADFVRVCALVLLVAGTIAGCGSPRAAGTVEVTGSVTLDGNTVDAASVAFIGPQGKVLATTTTDPTGNFKLYAALGKNSVTVSKGAAVAVVPQKEADMLMPSSEEYQALPQAPSAFPPKYADPKTSGIVIDVSKGMQPQVISLSSS